MSRERRLGRGLQALLGNPMEEGEAGENGVHQFSTDDAPPSVDLELQNQAPSEAPVTEDGKPAGVILLGVYEVDGNPFQPRREFSESEIASLSESLKEHDMLQPIMVRQVDDRYQLIAGERRLRAAIQAGWTHVPAQVREADDRLVAELAIVENLQRQDLNAIEKALSFQRYIQEHECTQEDLAKRIKVERSTIANMMRLLELPETVKKALTEKKITAGHARALLPLAEESQQNEMCQKIQDDGLSVRAIEQAVREKLDDSDKSSNLSVIGADGIARPVGKPKNPHLADLEQQLRVALGTKVEIKQSGKQKGRLVIHFNNHEEFDRIREVLSQSTTPAEFDMSSQHIAEA